LLACPGRAFHVLELGGADAEPGELVDMGDAGELLDATARDAYRRRIRDLEGELGEAESWADAGRRDRLVVELELVREELARGSGLGGRERRAAGAVERARVNVQKRLRGLVRKLRETLPDLADHLDGHIKTGTYVTYTL
jgi:hypothetical protein